MQTRIYHPSSLNEGETIELTPNASNHCTKVLRLRVGSAIVVFNGNGMIYEGQILNLGKKVNVEIQSGRTESVESPLEIHLAQGLARHDRMDWIIQKAVECGASSITPLKTQQSIVKMKADRLEHKMQHWGQIIISACEQSGRNVLPTLHEPKTLEQWFAQSTLPTLMCHPEADTKLREIEASGAYNLLLGPESGFSDNEVKIALAHQSKLISLGPRILRTETATISALSALQALFGD